MIVLGPSVFLLGNLLTLSAAGPMQDQLNGMKHLMDGGTQPFDETFYQELVSCFQELDGDSLMDTQDAQWVRFVKYAAKGGNPALKDGAWPPCDQYVSGSATPWFEDNCTVQAEGNIPIYEPCNYASNIAYYHAALEVCKKRSWSFGGEHVVSMVSSLAMQAQGSAFFHASRTYVGAVLDVKMTDIFAYVVHQAVISSLGEINNTLIRDLSKQNRAMSAVDVTEKVRDVIIREPVENWTGLVDSLDVPPARLGMCGIFSAAFAVSIEEDGMGKFLEQLLLGLFGGNGDEISEFCLNEYMPEIQAAINGLPIAKEERKTNMKHLVGMFLKIMNAFIWQENFVAGTSWLYWDWVNEVGAKMLPQINKMVNAVFLRDYTADYHGRGFQLGQSVYPGEKWCNSRVPHAKWHLQSAIGLVDIALLADRLHGTLTKATKASSAAEP